MLHKENIADCTSFTSRYLAEGLPKQDNEALKDARRYSTSYSQLANSVGASLLPQTNYRRISKLLRMNRVVRSILNIASAAMRVVRV